MSEPMEHISRPALPWHDGPTKTECGRPISEFASVISLDEANAKFKRLGKQRGAMSTCMTCVSTAGRYRHHSASSVPVETDRRPIAVLLREWEGAAWGDKPEVEAEYEAICAVVLAHLDEFREYLAGRAETASLSDRRKKRASSERRRSTPW